jgi:hypothetical protein
MRQIDLLPASDRERRIETQTRALRQALRNSKFAAAPIVCVAAAVGGEKVAAVEGNAPRNGKDS